MKPVTVSIIKAEKRGRRTTIVFESDLYSDEIFAVNPFYDEGDDKNQLQEVLFYVEVKEKSGKIAAKVGFGNSLCHFTKGLLQIHEPLTNLYKDKKDQARHYILNRREFDDRHESIFKVWEHDAEFLKELKASSKKVHEEKRLAAIQVAKENLRKAMSEYETLVLTPITHSTMTPCTTN